MLFFTKKYTTGCFLRKPWKKIEFVHISKDSKNPFADAYDEAIRRGHNPIKNIEIEAL